MHLNDSQFTHELHSIILIGFEAIFSGTIYTRMAYNTILSNIIINSCVAIVDVKFQICTNQCINEKLKDKKLVIDE